MFDVVDPSGGGGQGRRAGEERRDKWRWYCSGGDVNQARVLSAFREK